MNSKHRSPNFEAFSRRRPEAWAIIKGNDLYPGLIGNIRFYDSDYGTFVITEIHGLPIPSEECRNPIFAFHIHSGGVCSGNNEDSFASAGMHYNPHGCSHPYHAGDMPPLFGANGYAYSAFLTNRFTVHEIIGKTVIIHSAPDDFTTQPSGNSGMKIGCGEIQGRRSFNNRG